MASYENLNKRVSELHEVRFKEFEQELLCRKASAERDVTVQKGREKRRREFMASIGTDLKKLDAGIEEEENMQEAELKAFLEEFRPKSAYRRQLGAAASRDAALRSEILAESGHMVLPVFASSIFAADTSLFASVDALDWTSGALGSGWVLPDDPSKIRIMDARHYPNALCWDNRQDLPPEFAIHFTFVPAATSTYEMTAVLGFHGFYILRCDDSWWNCRDSGVRLKVQMNVNQYTDTGWRDFPLLDVEKDNAEEVISYDRTHFLDYTAGLRMGDPVVVTVRGVVEAYAHGAGAYAELNFSAGTANYIQSVFLSVQEV
ncbi:hypothetical protein [Caballeronia sp. GaOx3]|uniref:hypothetical protein n=1 Tax=Caballeronia sp. GaOx3 TaxID=2921740 RepID=UPI0020296514|nr:hypothetical protein [Caballeronia sp. GaOx3]